MKNEVEGGYGVGEGDGDEGGWKKQDEEGRVEEGRRRVRCWGRSWRRR